jgi:tripartite-type tricarboxylate transporter receptor subunit TctC
MASHIRRSLLGFIAAAFVGASGAAMAAFPDKPIRLVVPYGGGGMGTVFAQMVSETLATRLKSPVYVDYKPGANATIGTDLVAKAPADGYTLLMVTTSSLTINPAFLPNVHYDPIKDFTPVSMVWISRNVLYSNPKSAKTLNELIQLGKTRPLAYGSLGAGSLAHLSGEMLVRQANLQSIHVPYKGQGQVMTEVAGGRLDFAFTDPTGLQLAESGRVQALAVTGPQRLASAPNIPTLAELGYPNVGTLSWIGIVAPAGTPKPIVDLISRELSAAFQDEAMKAKVLSLGVEVAPDLSPAYFDREIRQEVDRWKKFQAETKITVE